MSASALKKPAPIFAALGDETRLVLVQKLCDQSPQSIAQLTDGLSLSRQGVTKHLRALEDAGLVRSLRVGRENLFEFEPQPLAELQKYLERVSLDWDQSLQRLKAFVEN